MDLEDYVAAGYFLSRIAGEPDCTGIQLRRVSLGSDHSQRHFFPDAWAISWCKDTRDDRLEHAAVFGITDEQLDEVMAWADKGFEREFGAWSLFFTIESARAAALSMLGNAPELDIWGVGLPRSLLSSFLGESGSSPATPGSARRRAHGTHIDACLRSLPFAEGGEILGHEILAEGGTWLDSPESLHVDEQAMYKAVGVVPNGDGLIDSLDDALACCCDLTGCSPIDFEITDWLPWLLVRYPRA